MIRTGHGNEDWVDLEANHKSGDMKNWQKPFNYGFVFWREQSNRSGDAELLIDQELSELLQCFENSKDRDDREQLTFKVGQLHREREIRAESLPAATTGSKVRKGARDGGDRVSGVSSDDALARSREMKRLVDDGEMNISAAARDMADRRLGSFEANRKLYYRKL